MNVYKSIHHPRYRKLVRQLIKLRKEKGIVQKQISEATGMSQSTISKIEKCERRIDVIELEQWLEFLGFSLAGFMKRRVDSDEDD